MFFFQILTFRDFQIKYDDSKESFVFPSGDKLLGIVLCRVLCPQTMLYPYLQHRNKNQTTSTPVCKKCSIKQQKSPCRHSNR